MDLDDHQQGEKEAAKPKQLAKPYKPPTARKPNNQQARTQRKLPLSPRKPGPPSGSARKEADPEIQTEIIPTDFPIQHSSTLFNLSVNVLSISSAVHWWSEDSMAAFTMRSRIKSASIFSMSRYPSRAMGSLKAHRIQVFGAILATTGPILKTIDH